MSTNLLDLHTYSLQHAVERKAIINLSKLHQVYRTTHFSRIQSIRFVPIFIFRPLHRAIQNKPRSVVPKISTELSLTRGGDQLQV
jgi:hypothetical protein